MLVVKIIKPLSERLHGSMLALAMIEPDATATRSVALAGVAALAVYGMTAIQGARHDLISGLDAALVQYLDTADVWVTTDNNFLTIDSFQDHSALADIARTPQVASVCEYQGLLDVGTRRLWIRARPAGVGQTNPGEPATARPARTSHPAAPPRRVGRNLQRLRRRTPPRRRGCLHASFPSGTAPFASRQSRPTSAGRPARSQSTTATTSATGKPPIQPHLRSTSSPG